MTYKYSKRLILNVSEFGVLDFDQNNVTTKISLKLPKFKIGDKIMLNDPLKGIGKRIRGK